MTRSRLQLAMTLDEQLDDIKRARIWSELEDRIARDTTTPRRSHRSLVAGGIAFACAAATILAVALWRSSPSPPPNMFVVPAGATVNARLGPHTRAAVVGPARLTLRRTGDATVVALARGTLLADFAGGSNRTLQIDAPGAMIEIVGTLFSVDASATTTCTSVAHGRVKVTSTASGKVMFVSGGERYCIDAMIQPIAPAVREALERHEETITAFVAPALPPDATAPTTSTSANAAANPTPATKPPVATSTTRNMTSTTHAGANATPATKPPAQATARNVTSTVHAAANGTLANATTTDTPASTRTAAAKPANATTPTMDTPPASPRTAAAKPMTSATVDTPPASTRTAAAKPANATTTAATTNTPLASTTTTPAAKPANATRPSADASTDTANMTKRANAPTASATTNTPVSVDTDAATKPATATSAMMDTTPASTNTTAATTNLAPTTAAPASTQPATASELYRAADTALAARDPGAADRALAALVSRYPDSPLVEQALFDRARIAHQRKQWKSARQHLARPTSGLLAEPSHWLRCRIEIDAGENGVARTCLAAYRRVYASSPHDLDALALLARLAHATGGCRAAAADVDALASRYPRTSLAASWRARCPEKRER